VVEVNRPDRARRRRKGKTDPVDAEAAARAVLAGDARAIPKDRNGAVGELRALMVARRSAIKARTQAPTSSAPCWWTATTSSAAGCEAYARPTWHTPAPSLAQRRVWAWPWPAWVAAGWP
jgi:hypothetical protein